MIIVDTALAKRHQEKKPVRLGMIGAGFMARGIALQINKYTPGMQVAAIANISIPEAERAYQEAEISRFRRVADIAEFDAAIEQGYSVITEDPALMCRSKYIDALLEVTGTIDFAAAAVLSAINNGKHAILLNSELDATLGPILKVYADRAGVIYSNADGDQPGVIMNLYRYVKMLGFKPVLLGNIKGLHDPYRTPQTQKGYAEKYHQRPKMVTSFADGTKISMEMAVVANATNFKAGKRGMYGPSCSHVKESAHLFPMEQMLNTGLVDYVVGAEPAGGIFVIGYNPDPTQREYLKYYKMGDGPLYVFYTPYHLCHFEVPLSVARVVLFKDAVLTPIGAPVVEVITAAKKDLKTGEVLDGMGGFAAYGLLENADISSAQNLLPMGLSEGCSLKRNIPKDAVLTCDDVSLPPGRLCDRLKAEQNEYFFPQKDA